MNEQAIINNILVNENEFSVQIADTPALITEAFRLRYQVYCVERDFMPGENNQEADEYDVRSRHLLLRHSRDGEVVGAVRIVAPDLDALDDSFPMQRVCESPLPRYLPLYTTGEISRFAISKSRRMNCASAVLLRLCLMRGIMQLSDEMGLTHWVAIMEHSLLRLLRLSAIHFHPIGPLVYHHGIRQPSAGSIAAILGRMETEQPSVWNYVTAGGTYCQSQMIGRTASQRVAVAA